MDHPNPSAPDDSGDAFAVLPLHGTEVPAGGSSSSDSPPLPFLKPDDDVPPADFQPRLSRFGEAA